MSDKLLIFNWKMNPATLKKALFLAKVSEIEVDWEEYKNEFTAFS